MVRIRSNIEQRVYSTAHPPLRVQTFGIWKRQFTDHDNISFRVKYY